MTKQEKNDLFYVCCLIEFIGRETHNKRGLIVDKIGAEGIDKLLYDAPVNHCLTFEQVSDEVIEQYHIPNGTFDTITDCPYRIPSFTAIGKLYSDLIEDTCAEGHEQEGLFSIFRSFISDEISNFRTGVYFENPSYLIHSYYAGYLVE